MKYICVISCALLVLASCVRNSTADNQSNVSKNPITHADVQHWLSAWNSHNLDSINALFADDAVIYQPQNPKPLTKQNMNQFFGMVFKTYPDITFKMDGITVEGYDAASWEDVTGTFSGRLPILRPAELFNQQENVSTTKVQCTLPTMPTTKSKKFILSGIN